MPKVTIEFFKGRTLDQKRAMVKQVTEAISNSISVSPDVVSITIHEIDGESFSQGGILSIDKK